MHNPKCWSNHMGQWACWPKWFSAQANLFMAGSLPIVPQDADGPLYDVQPNGVAIIGLYGPLMKERSKYGGTSTIRARQALRAAAKDPQVSAILLHIDSPGGTVAGTEELSNDVRQINDRKPVYAHADDLVASAAFWVGSQARRLTMNAGGLAGSIGVYAIVTDSSKAAEMKGIKVHTISSGPLKGAGAEGTEITPEILADEQRIVDGMNARFLNAVSMGRGRKVSEVKEWATGQVWSGEESKAMGLIDQVASFEESLAFIASRHRLGATPRNDRAEIDIRLRD